MNPDSSEGERVPGWGRSRNGANEGFRLQAPGFRKSFLLRWYTADNLFFLKPEG